MAKIISILLVLIGAIVTSGSKRSDVSSKRYSLASSYNPNQYTLGYGGQLPGSASNQFLNHYDPKGVLQPDKAPSLSMDPSQFSSLSSGGNPDNPKKTVILAIPVKLALQVPDKKDGGGGGQGGGLGGKEENYPTAESNPSGNYETDGRKIEEGLRHHVEKHLPHQHQPQSNLGGPANYDDGLTYNEEGLKNRNPYGPADLDIPAEPGTYNHDSIKYDPLFKGADFDLSPFRDHRPPFPATHLGGPYGDLRPGKYFTTYKSYPSRLNVLPTPSYLPLRPKIRSLRPSYSLHIPQIYRRPLSSPYPMSSMSSLRSYSLLKPRLTPIHSRHPPGQLFGSGSSPLKVYLPPKLSSMAGPGLSSQLGMLRQPMVGPSPLGRYPSSAISAFLPPGHGKHHHHHPFSHLSLYRKLF